MTRLALARTLVTGTVTLQGNAFTFTASGSGTATGDIVAEAKKLAVTAANTAAIAAARASIDQILLNNSAVLTDLEITSLISNNLSTTVLVYRPLALSKIATTTDGVNYIINKKTTIGKRQWLMVPNGKNLDIVAPFIIKGYFQIGEPIDATKSLKSIITTKAMAYYTVMNYGYVVMSDSAALEINDTWTNNSTGAIYGGILSYGIVDNYSTIFNQGEFTFVINEKGATLTNYGPSDTTTAAVINNAGFLSYLLNRCGGTINNNTGATIESNTTQDAYFLNNGDVISDPSGITGTYINQPCKL